jgi:hypothetical protein
MTTTRQLSSDPAVISLPSAAASCFPLRESVFRLHERDEHFMTYSFAA